MRTDTFSIGRRTATVTQVARGEYIIHFDYKGRVRATHTTSDIIPSRTKALQIARQFVRS
jgi:hypothetical protein